MNLSETNARIVSIGEPDSPARQLAYNRAFRQGRALSLLPRLLDAERAIAADTPSSDWLIGNRRLLAETFAELRKLLKALAKTPLPLAADGPFLGYPRIFEIASALVDHGVENTPSTLTPESMQGFLQDYQAVQVLTMAEMWSIDTMLQVALLEGLSRALPQAVPAFIASLKSVREADWQLFFEHHSRTENILRQDPTGHYERMDFATRDRYRHAVEQIARLSDATEEAVAQAAISLALEAARTHGTAPPQSPRRRHVGYHLIDRGAERLKAAFQYHPDWRTRVADHLLEWPTAYYLIAIELFTLAMAATLLSLLPGHLGYLGLIIFFLATEPAIALANALVTSILPPRRLPKLDFSEGIPADCVTMAVVPTLLLNEAFVSKLLHDLEVRFLANRDPRLCFALLTDFPDAASATHELDHLAERCADGVRSLNERYGSRHVQPFYLFHRRHVWNPKQATWMGLERKRGKLIALNNLLRGVDDAFHIKVGELSVLPQIRFVITLDSDTELPHGTAQQLAGTLAHPLNQAVVDPRWNIVREGYGILQPRVGIGIDSARRSRLAAIYSGQIGYDLYSTAVSDVYQDLFGEGSYVGKGIYDVDVFQQTLARRFPHDLLLSHDLIEGTYARAALVSDIELIDDYPSHYSAWSKRKHRWTRGDWQIMLWLLPRVPDYSGKLVPNPLSVISHWKIVDNLRRSLLEIAVFILLLAGWTFLPGGPVYWTSVILIVTVLPVFIGTAFSLLRLPGDSRYKLHLADAARAFVTGHVEAVFRLIFLPHQACIMLDAILRSVVRTTVTGRRMLEWESAAQAELGAKKRSDIETYLWLAMPLSLLASLAVLYVNPASLPLALPFLVAWFLSPVIALWLNAPLTRRKDRLRAEDRTLLRDIALRTWRYFTDFATPENNWLAPDNVREQDSIQARRISPTNLGLLLNAHLAALDFGFIQPAEFLHNIGRIFTTMQLMQRERGHFLNWYAIDTLQPLAPRFVSTVDSGNLAAALITLRQGLLELESSLDPSQVRHLADEAARYVQEMDFAFLLKPKRKLFHIGWNADTLQLDAFEYDSLASESRIASIIAIAKNDVPYTHWARLGRRVVQAAGGPTLLSWSGTMFEYLMPNLWMKRYPDTLLDQTACNAVRCQRQYGTNFGMPWGISESACATKVHDDDYRYYAFGIPDLAANPEQDRPWVIAPYATMLALDVDPRAAIENLQDQIRRGWLAPHGFYEAADFLGSTNRETLVRIFMAHHHGMSLVALSNLLHDDRMRERFHREPMIEATALLLHERRARFAAPKTPLDRALGNPHPPLQRRRAS